MKGRTQWRSSTTSYSGKEERRGGGYEARSCEGKFMVVVYLHIQERKVGEGDSGGKREGEDLDRHLLLPEFKKTQVFHRSD